MTASSSCLAWIKSVTVRDKFAMFSIFTPDDDDDDDDDDGDDDEYDDYGVGFDKVVEPHCDGDECHVHHLL